MSDGIGLVLAGGGGKGAYQVGVWKAFREFGVDRNIVAVAGTSVGALNAALFAQGEYEAAERLWSSISPGDVLTVDYAGLSARLLAWGASPRIIAGAVRTLGLAGMGRTSGFFSRKRLEQLITENLRLDALAAAHVSCYATCCRLPLFQTEYFALNACSPGKIIAILLASSAIPVLFAPQEIDGSLYIDGGVTDNVPVQPLYDAKCRYIFVVHGGRDSSIDHERFPGATLLEIVPQEDQGDLVTGTLDFTADGARRRMGHGYKDALRILQPIYEMGLVQKQIGAALDNMAIDEQRFLTMRGRLEADRDALNEELQKIINGA